MTLPATFKQMFSAVSEDGILTLGLENQPMPTPSADEVIIRVEAAPINPSDHAVMFGWASMDEAKSSGNGTDSVLSAPVAPEGMHMMRARIGQSLPVGNEGAGTVVAAGDGDIAQSLLGKVVAVIGGASMYAEYRCAPAANCMPLLPDCSAKDGASSLVNPLTALGFVETMRMEGHKALVHTAAASNLGLMLNKVCKADGVDIVNIVRRPEQVEFLEKLGAKYIVNSGSNTFASDLTDAIHETGATLAFDAIGGGELASTILLAMEEAINRNPQPYTVYGSTTHKQLYIYGGLNLSPTSLSRLGYGMAWGVGGWLLLNFLARVKPEVIQRMRMRVVNELKTTFASHYTDEISLTEALSPEIVSKYNAKKTGSKFLICPHQ